MAGAELILRAKKAADNACIAAELASLRTAMNASFARTDRRQAVLDARTTAARAYTVRYLLDDERERRRQLKLAAVQGKLTPRDDLLRAEQRERGAAASLALHAGERARRGGSATSSGTQRPRPSRTRGRRGGRARRS